MHVSHIIIVPMPFKLYKQSNQHKLYCKIKLINKTSRKLKNWGYSENINC